MDEIQEDSEEQQRRCTLVHRVSTEVINVVVRQKTNERTLKGIQWQKTITNQLPDQSILTTKT